MPSINVKLPDGSLQPLNFPEGMSDAQIQMAIHKEYGMSSSARNSPFQNIDSMPDKEKFLYKMMPGATQIPIGMKEGFQGATSALPGIGKYFPEPKAPPIPENVESSTLFRNVGRTAGALPVLAGVGAPIAAGASALGVPALAAELGAAGIAGAATTPGGIGERALGAAETIAPFGIKPLAKIIGGVPGAIKGIANTIKNARMNLSPLEAKAAETSQLADTAQAAHEGTKAQAAVMGQSSNPDVVQGKLLQNQQKLNELHGQLADVPPVTPRNVDQSQANLQSLNETREKAQQAVQNTESTIGQHLNQGMQHDVRAATQIQEAQDKIRSGIGKGYDELEQNLKGKNIQINNSDRIADLNSQVLKMLKDNRVDTKEGKQLLDELHGLEGQQESIPASDYLRAYRNARQLAREARQKAYQPGMKAEERNEWKQRYDALDDKVEEMGDVLEQGIGKEDYQKLHDLNNQWRTKVVPLYRNTTFQKILKSNQMDDNIIKKLRGNEAGNMLMKNIIQNDPAILKNVVGQRYAVRPNEIHNPNETMREYMDKMPELKQMLNQRNQANVIAKRADENVMNAEKQHKELTEQAQQRAEQHQQINEVQEKIAKQERIIAELRKTANRKDISLAEKAKAESELAKATQAKTKAQQKLWMTGSGLGAFAGVNSLVKLGKNLLTGHPEGE